MSNKENKDLFQEISDETMLKASDLLEEKHRLEQELKILEAQIKTEEKREEKPKCKKECPVCYCDLHIDNIVNLQCSHSLCKGCFKSWVDEGGKNSCPQCRADVLSSSSQKIRFQKKIADYEHEVHILEDEINEHNHTINNQLDMVANLRKQKKVLKQHVLWKQEEAEELKNDCEYWQNKYDAQETKSDEIYNAWLRNPNLAIKHWENKKNKIYNGQIKKAQNLKKKCISDLKNVFELMDNWPKKPTFIKNHIIAYDIADRFKKKYDEEKEVDLSDFNIFQEDTSSYKEVEGLETRLKCETRFCNGCDCCGKERVDESIYDSMPELVSASETESDEEEDYSHEHFIPSVNWGSVWDHMPRSVRSNITPRSLEREFNSVVINNLTQI